MRRSVPTVIIDPRTLLREGLASLLHDSNFRVTASVATWEELPELSPGHTGLVIVGLAKGTPDDLQVLEKISRMPRDYKIIALVEAASASAQLDISQVLRSGADGYIFNVHSRDVLLKSLELALLEQKLVVLGDDYDPAGASGTAGGQPSSGDSPRRNNGNTATHPGLSDRELEILSCLASGHSNKLIARTCRIAEATVKIHLKSILRKLDVQNRTQAAIWAIQNRLAGLSESPPLASTDISQGGVLDLFGSEDLSGSELG